MTELQIADGFTLPLDAATRRIAMLATSGAGKSNAAVVMAEAMFAAGVPWVAIDPKGDWWGVRSSMDGKSAGLSVPIFGGLHGDIPLEAHAGKVLAETIAKQRLSCVIDVSQFESRQAMLGFLADFAETLLRRNTEPLHGFLDECHTYIPQVSRDKGNGLRCLGAWERLIGQGRNKGLGTTQISQRAQLVNKNALDLVDCMVAMRNIAPRSIDVVEDWMSSRLPSAERKALVDSLPTLANGEAWVYAPEWIPGDPRRVRFNMRWTFDSAATPEVGKSLTVPTTLADIDLVALGGRIAETAERQRADDPKVLKARIAELERAARAKPAPEVDTETVAMLTAERDAMRDEANRRGVLLKRAEETIARISQQVETYEAVNAADDDATMPMAAPVAVRPAPRPAPVRAAIQTRPVVQSDAALGKAERSVLSVLAQYPQGRTMSQIALLAGYRQSGGFRNTLSALRTAGRIEGANGEQMRITDVGLDALGPFDPLPTGRDLLEFWLNDSRLGKAHRAVLQAAYDAYPNALTVEDAAIATGYQVSGGFRNVLSYLRTSELIDGPNAGFTASSLFFEAQS